MNNIYDVAYDYTVKLGIAPCVTGFERFADAVVVYATCSEIRPLKTVCEQIGVRRSLNPRTVLRAINYAIKTADDLCGKIYEQFGLKVRQEDIRPKYVICLVAQCIKRDLGL